MNVEHDHRHGTSSCAICRRHDHTNTATYGFDRDGTTVPGWYFTCPKCGGGPNAQMFIERGWTKDGIAYMRANTNGAA